MKPRERNQDRERKYVQLRNQHRAEIASRKRSSTPFLPNLPPPVPLSLPSLHSSLSQFLSEDQVFTSLSSLHSHLLKHSPEAILESLDLQIHSDLIRLMEIHSQSQRIIEICLTCVATLAAGPRNATLEMASSGVFPLFSRYLPMLSSSPLHQTVLAIGNFAGDSANLRNELLSMHIHRLISSQMMNFQADTALYRVAAWTLSNLCRGQPTVEMEFAEELMGILWKIVSGNGDELTVASALYGVSYLTNSGPDYIQLLLRQASTLPFLSHLILTQTHSIRLPAFKIIGNIVAGDHLQTQKVMEIPLFPLLHSCVHSQHASLRREVFYILSNLSAGTLPQIDALLSDSLAQELVNAVEDTDPGVRKEALWGVFNLVRTCSPLQLHKLLHFGLFLTLKSGFLFPDVDYTHVNPYIAPVTSHQQRFGKDGRGRLGESLEEYGGNGVLG